MTAVALSPRRSAITTSSTGSVLESRRLGAEELHALLQAVSSVPDPELGGVTIGELGLVHEIRPLLGDGVIEVFLLPTFLGCPALKLMERDVVAVLSVLSVSPVRVTWVNWPIWSPDRISFAGRSKLAELGIAVPCADVADDIPVCPICSVDALEAKLPVGPTACRSVAWCTSCRSVVEIMRGSHSGATGGSYANV